jgi:hypothetical protein
VPPAAHSAASTVGDNLAPRGLAHLLDLGATVLAAQMAELLLGLGNTMLAA